MCLFFGSLGLLQNVSQAFKKMSKTQLMHFLPGRRVRGEALDEESHGDDEADAHEEDTVPIGLQKENC